MTGDDSDPDDFDLVEFLDHRSDLFVVMGVFAALSVYLSQASTTPLNDAPDTVRGGYVATLVITVLVAVLIYEAMAKKIGSRWDLVRAHTQSKNLGLVVFTIMFLLLIQALATLALQFEGIIFQFLTVTGAIVNGLVVLSATAYILETEVSNWTLIMSDWIAGTCLLWAGLEGMTYVEQNLPILESENFQLAAFWNIWPNAIQTFFTMSVLMGLALVFTATVITSLQLINSIIGAIQDLT